MQVRPAELSVEFDGQRHELQRRVMQVLVALAKGRPGVVSRDKLVELCWEGRVVGDDALNRCILALRHLAQDFSPPPFIIETVPRIGHRLIENGEANTASYIGETNVRLPIARSLAAAFLTILIVAAGFLLWQKRSVDSDPVSIAVLPFRNLSSGDPYLAEGVGEEILDQLAREPAFEVAGSASAAKFAGSDPREVRRSLGVDYVLEGNVRSDVGRVRVSASLVKTSDGMRLWSETYDRKLEDLLAIQSAIGQAVAGELKRRLVHSAAGGPVNGEAYALYLNARGLLRSQNPQSAQEALAALRQAIRLDPNYAPAWSSFAEALLLDGRTKGPDGLIAVVPRAQNAAARALRLDPKLAEAHSVAARLAGSESPAAIAHLRRAADLDRRGGDGMMSLGVAREVSGEYAEAIAAYRRAHEVDPAWPVPVRGLVTVLAIMGDRPGAHALALSGFPGDTMTQHFALARVAWFSGDISEAARRWSIVAADPNARFTSSARVSLEDTKYALKISTEMPARPALATLGSSRFGPRIWMTAPPTPGAWLMRNRSNAAALVNYDENVVAAKLMLNAGRARELVATYDSPTGLLSLKPGLRLGPCQLDEAAIVALALRGAGRTAEANALLGEADALVKRLYRRGTVPTWFEEDAAGIWAAQGKAGPAAEALERALRRGWVHVGRTDLASIEAEPAFRTLGGHPRFQAYLANYKKHFAQERAEAARAFRKSV